MISAIKRTLRRLQPNRSLAPGYFPISHSLPEDIFVAGYPKSGNTWVQNLIAGVLFGLDTLYLPDKLTQDLVPDVMAAKSYKRYFDFTCFKTHELPQPQHRRVVHLVRDGRDAMASYFAMNQSLGSEVTMSQMIKEGKGIHPCKWHVHTREWMSNPYGAEILIMRYEDLKADPIQQMRGFCEFAGLDRPEDVLERSVSGSSFSNMQKKEAEFGWNNQNWDKKEKFIRKGIVGGYRNEISEDLIEHFERESADELAAFGYPFAGH